MIKKNQWNRIKEAPERLELGNGTFPDLAKGKGEWVKAPGPQGIVHPWAPAPDPRRRMSGWHAYLW